MNPSGLDAEVRKCSDLDETCVTVWTRHRRICGGQTTAVDTEAPKTPRRPGPGQPTDTPAPIAGPNARSFDPRCMQRFTPTFDLHRDSASDGASGAESSPELSSPPGKIESIGQQGN